LKLTGSLGFTETSMASRQRSPEWMEIMKLSGALLGVLIGALAFALAPAPKAAAIFGAAMFCVFVAYVMWAADKKPTAGRRLPPPLSGRLKIHP
jgi:uncharacterized membrane protein YfcA